MKIKLELIVIILFIIFSVIIFGNVITDNKIFNTLLFLFILTIFIISIIYSLVKIHDLNIIELIKGQSKAVKICLILWVITFIYDVSTLHSIYYSNIFPGLLIFIIFFQSFFKKEE